MVHEDRKVNCYYYIYPLKDLEKAKLPKHQSPYGKCSNLLEAQEDYPVIMQIPRGRLGLT